MILSSLVLSSACTGAVGTDGSSTETSVVCTTSPTTLHTELAVPGHTWRLNPHCDEGGGVVCHAAAECGDTEPPSTLYDVYRDGELVSVVCLTPQEHLTLDQPWPGDVEAAVARQSWPAPVLRVQPRRRTLVNLATNLYTPSTARHTTTVVLLGYATTITLTPVSYTWHYGDGSGRTTVSPGAAYPAMPLTHVYRRSGVTLHPSVDETFRVSYAFAGGAGTLDTPVRVRGDRRTLAVLTATPHLLPWD